MILPLYAILLGENIYIESGWYRVIGANAQEAVDKLANEIRDKTPMSANLDINKNTLNVIDVHVSVNAVII